jgi:hypothetical protein
VKLILKGDDQSTWEEPTRSNKHILLKNVRSERMGASSNILDLKKNPI